MQEPEIKTLCALLDNHGENINLCCLDAQCTEQILRECAAYLKHIRVNDKDWYRGEHIPNVDGRWIIECSVIPNYEKAEVIAFIQGIIRGYDDKESDEREEMEACMVDAGS